MLTHNGRVAAALLAAIATVLLGGVQLRGEEPEHGFRSLTVYRTADYDEASSQNFAATEDRRGIIYVANAAGVLEYDGVFWRLITIRNDSPVLTVAALSDGRILVGGVEELGYLVSDSDGDMKYVSLTSRLGFPPEQMGELIDARPTNEGAVFVTTRCVVLLRGDQVKVLERYEERPSLRAFVIDGSMWLSTEEGLRRVSGDRIVPVTGWEAFSGQRVRFAKRWSATEFFVFLGEKGSFLFDGTSKRPFNRELAARFERDRFVNALSLTDGRVAIITRRAGVHIVSADGSVDEVIDHRAGMPDADISDAYVASDGALWIAMDNDVARVDVSTPLTVIDSRSNLRGSVEAIARFNGVLYVGTTSGLYRLRPTVRSGAGPNVEVISPDVLATWSLLPVGDEMLAGIHDGIAIIRKDGSFGRIAGVSETTPYCFLRSAHDPDIVYAGLSSGFGVLRRRGGSWTFEGIIDVLPRNVRSIVEEKQGVLWLGTTVNGLVRAEVNHSGARTVAKARQFGEKWSATFRVANRVVIIDDSRVFRTIDSNGRIVVDQTLAAVPKSSDIYTLAEDAAGNVWMNSRPIGVARKQQNGQYEFDDSLLVDAPGQLVDFIYPERDGVIWIGSDRGLIRFDSARVRSLPAPRKPLIRRVTVEGDALDRRDAFELPYRFGRIRFEVSSLAHAPGSMYQYRLSPVEEKWSEWTSEPFREFTALWEGDYELLVRTRNVRRMESAVAAVSFRVLPPWYRSGVAYLVWALLALLLVATVVRLRGRALRVRTVTLEEQVRKKTEELTAAFEQLRAAKQEVEAKNLQLEQANVRLEELSYDDPLTGIANRRELDQSLRAEWNRAMRSETSLAFVLLDIDHFKALNDTRGHQIGDECLKHIAELLEDQARRSGDLAARYGGEEFALVLPDTELPGAVHIAEALRQKIAALRIAHPAAPEGIVTASFGVAAVTPREKMPLSDLVAAADRALYRAKSEGRNRVAVADEERATA